MNLSSAPLPVDGPADLSATPSWNPWPYALIAYFAVFISAVVAFTAWSLHQKMDLVGADYYDQDIRYQSQIDRIARTAAVSPEVQVEYLQGQVVLQLPREQAVRGISGTVQLYRPSNAGMDRTVPLAVDPSGTQRIEAKNLIPGLWRIRMGWKVGNEEFFRDTTVVVPHADGR